MDTILEKYIDDLRAQVGQMAGLVEEAVQLATKALAAKDSELIGQVQVLEDQINGYHKKIDRLAFKLLARQSPVASDLRMILAIGRMNVDLERMGDLARSIAFCVQDYLRWQPVLLANEVPKMSDLVRSMVRKSVDAFSQKNVALAEEVLELDDTVDDYRDQLSQQLRSHIKDLPVATDSCLELFKIVRNLERLGDHATNIAEEVIFSLTGKDIRHANFNNLVEGNDGISSVQHPDR